MPFRPVSLIFTQKPIEKSWEHGRARKSSYRKQHFPTIFRRKKLVHKVTRFGRKTQGTGQEHPENSSYPIKCPSKKISDYSLITPHLKYEENDLTRQENERKHQER
jgi:hypothetical protein